MHPTIDAPVHGVGALVKNPRNFALLSANQSVRAREQADAPGGRLKTRASTAGTEKVIRFLGKESEAMKESRMIELPRIAGVG